MSVLVLPARSAVDVSSTVAVSLPGPNVFAIVATVALLVMVAAMVYFGFVIGRDYGQIGDIGAEPADESDSREADEEEGDELQAEPP